MHTGCECTHVMWSIQQRGEKNQWGIILKSRSTVPNDLWPSWKRPLLTQRKTHPHTERSTVKALIPNSFQLTPLFKMLGCYVSYSNHGTKTSVYIRGHLQPHNRFLCFTPWFCLLFEREEGKNWVQVWRWIRNLQDVIFIPQYSPTRGSVPSCSQLRFNLKVGWVKNLKCFRYNLQFHSFRYRSNTLRTLQLLIHTPDKTHTHTIQLREHG